MLSNSQFGSHDSTEQDLSSSMSSELEHPGEGAGLHVVSRVPTTLYLVDYVHDDRCTIIYMGSHVHNIFEVVAIFFNPQSQFYTQICPFYVVTSKLGLKVVVVWWWLVLINHTLRGRAHPWLPA